jgi:hypothetical protein
MWIGQIDCVQAKDSSWKAIAKLNSKAIEGKFPILNGHRPLFSNVANGEPLLEQIHRLGKHGGF